MSPVFLPCLWLLNGLLVLAYFLADHLLVVLLIPALTWLAATAPIEQRPTTTVASLLAILVAACAPAPVPVLLLLMAVIGIVAIPLEQFNPPALRWFIARGIALYSLLGLGFLAYQAYLAGLPTGGEDLLSQGRVYVSAIVGIAAYLFPLGCLAYLAQKILLHPPTRQSPGDLLLGVRTRGKITNNGRRS